MEVIQQQKEKDKIVNFCNNYKCIGFSTYTRFYTKRSFGGYNYSIGSMFSFNLFQKSAYVFGINNLLKENCLNKTISLSNIFCHTTVVENPNYGRRAITIF